MTKRKPTLLVVDDKPNMLRLISKVMRGDATMRTADNGAAALRILASETVDAVLCDLKMPDMDGLAVLKASKSLRPRAEFVLMTAYATVGTAVEAIKLGAYDYLEKPFEPAEARATLLRALARASHDDSNDDACPEVLPGVVARSKPMQELAALVTKIAGSDATALILGETGTGKERIARAVHELSPRNKRRFVALNCAAVPAALLESELFGHAKGAFTGAAAARAGLFEEASGGTLFLDEIGDMRPSLQAKLTRALEERAVRRVGESRERPVDVRLVAATHRDVQEMVAAGTFREDLWYRLNVAAIRVPPLRERRDDIELLAHHFLARQAEQRSAMDVRGFSTGALDVMVTYDWPGNVRQLRAAVERACIVAAGQEVTLPDLPPELLLANAEGDGDATIAAGTWAEALEHGRIEVGTRYLHALMRRFRGQVAEAAQHAGVERESFYRLLRKHQVDAAVYRTGSTPPPKRNR